MERRPGPRGCRSDPQSGRPGGTRAIRVSHTEAPPAPPLRPGSEPVVSRGFGDHRWNLAVRGLVRLASLTERGVFTARLCACVLRDSSGRRREGAADGPCRARGGISTHLQKPAEKQPCGVCGRAAPGLPAPAWTHRLRPGLLSRPVGCFLSLAAPAETGVSSGGRVAPCGALGACQQPWD